MTMVDEWKKVDAGETWNFKEQSEIVGTYILKEENVGPNNSKLYHIMLPDGNITGVWGNRVLDDKFSKVNIGEEVKIVYKGLETSEKTGREFNNFDFYHRKSEKNSE